MLHLMMIKSPFCPACKATMPLVMRINTRYPMIDFRYKDVAKAIPIPNIPKYLQDSMCGEDEENIIANFLENQCAIPIEIDTGLTEEEREEYRAEGVTELASLPTFVIWDDEQPSRYEVMAGGVGEDHNIKDDKQFEIDYIKMINKWVKRSEGVKMEVGFYGRVGTI